MHPPKGKRKEIAMREKESERCTKGKGGLYKKTTNSYSPSKVAKEWRNIPLLQKKPRISKLGELEIQNLS